MEKEHDREIKIMIEIAEKFLFLGAELLKGPFTIKEGDYDRMMALFFFRRQLEHLKSLLALHKYECDQDMFFISRSMIEGCVYLVWSDLDSDVSKKWATYLTVIGHTAVKNASERGERLDPQYVKEIEERVKLYGKTFVKKNKREDLKIDFKSDPFGFYWHVDDDGRELKFREICEKAELLNLVHPYEYMSSWSHWGMKGFSQIMARDDNPDMGFDYNNPLHMRYAFTSALLSFFRSALIFERRFELGRREEILALNKEYQRKSEEVD